MALIRKKLYFDVAFGSGTGGIGQAVNTTVAALYFPCTQFTNGVAGDRYGGVLQAVEALTGNAPNQIKSRNAVSAWFQLANVGALDSTLVATGTTCAIDFVMPTGTVATPGAGVTRLRSLSTAGATQFSKAGQEAIYGTLGTLRHFSVRIRRPNAVGVVGSGTSIRGVLYVQRQHTIEV
jgi:hypothetical protein